MVKEEDLLELILDETKANKEYAKMVNIDPHFRVLSEQEGRHKKFLEGLLKRLKAEGKLE